MLTELCAEEKDLVIIGGGVAGYVAAIKAGQEGLKVCRILSIRSATTIQNTV
jgi:pyruvate/2-oxoglutarate dehydrogenase complex dihydrolipoamide dehydrogenase (E3) component